MKTDLAKIWKRKQQKFNRKFGSVVKNKFKKRGVKRKFVLILSKKNKKCGAILKFINRNLCKAMWAVRINPKIKKQTARKFIISPEKNRKLLKNVEVIVSRKFKEDFLNVWRKAYEPEICQNEEKKEILPKITPIKIISCKECNHKFTSRKLFDGHKHSQIDIDLDSSSGSEKSMVIDDDVELILDDDDPISLQHPGNFLNLKEEPKADAHYCMMNNCGKVFETEEALVVHIGMQHESDDKPFPCKKCNFRFSRESGLIAHQRMVHSVEIIEPLPIAAPTKSRRKSHFFTMSPPSQPQSSETSKSKLSDSSNTIKFKRYDTKQNFVCRICSVSFDQRLHLDRHMTVHHISKVYFCYKCHTPYTYRMKLLNHLKTAHLKCVNDSGYIQTISNIESVSSHRCAFCQFTSKERNRADQHMTSEHYDEFEKSETNEEEEQEPASSPDSLENLFTAESANALNNKEEDEDDLLVEVPTKKKKPEVVKKRKPLNDPSFKYRCARCQRRFSRKKNLLTHACERVDVDIQAASVDPFPKKPSTMLNGFYKCNSCPQVFTDKTLFHRHHHVLAVTPKISSSSSFTSGYSS